MVINIKKIKTIKSIVTFLIIGLLTGFVGFTYAKFLSSIFSSSNGAWSAKWGTIEIREHILLEEKIDEEDEEKVTYYFSEETYPIENNSETLYSNLRKGRNIPFYPCVFLNGTFEVSFWLYLKVVDTNPNDYIPIEYHIDVENTWVKDEASSFTKNGVTTTIYRYKNSLPKAGEKLDKEMEIKILEHNALHVTSDFNAETYEGFDLKFSAWIQQIKDPSDKDKPVEPANSTKKVVNMF